MKKIRILRSPISAIAIVTFLLSSGCAAPRYESSCHKLATVKSSQIDDMVDKARGGTFERHFVLLETGTEISNTCRTHYIDKATYNAIPASLKGKCKAQSYSGDKYCTIYSVDGKTKKVRVY